MPLEEIKHEIEENARKEARRIREESRKECELVVSEARARAAAIVAEHERSLKAEIDLLNREYESSMEIGRKSAILAAMEEALEAEMRSIKRELVRKARASPGYPKIFKSALKSAKEMSTDGNYVIATSKKDIPLIGKTTAKVEAREMSGGLMIYSQDRSVSIDATLDKLIDASEEQIRKVINAHLFAGAKKAVAAKAAKATKKSKPKAMRKQKAVKKKAVKRKK
ncbi:MAG: hypothetical protein KGH66_02830 [Candidatus Micrarchaeota archaeon]|nr:hypothetical protein [Candidatus Micrarchaeota archaeon]